MANKNANSGGKDSASALRQALNVDSSPEAQQASGAHNADRGFPTSGKARDAAVAWTPGNFPVSDTHSLESLAFGRAEGAFQAGMDMELVGRLIQAKQFGAAEFAYEQAQKNISRIPEAPPTQVAVGNTIKFMPSSLREIPHRLHTNHQDEAMRLFHIFCGGKKHMVTRLASKAGHPSEPFLYLTQALYHLLDFKHFYISDVKEADAHFDETLEKDSRGDIQRELRRWSGNDLADLITDRCERANVSILCGLKKMYKQLDDRRLADLDQAKKFQTVHQWTGDEEDDIDD